MPSQVRLNLPALLLLLLCWTTAARAEEKLPKETVTFDGQTLFLQSDEKSPSVRLKEYIPKGQTFDNWTRLAGVFTYPRDNDAKAVVGRMIDALKKANPDAHAALIENPDNGELILDFITWPPGGAYVEFDVFLFSKNPSGGLLAKQYAMREFKNPKNFLKNIDPVRQRLIESMATGHFKISN